MLSLPSSILRASPTPHDALPDLSLEELIVKATRTVEHGSWVTVLDIMRSPKLSRMAFPACDRRDTEEVATPVGFWGVAMIAFA
jgi:hypothetical protein